MTNKFNNKKPIELTEEETYELVKQIAEIEYSRNASAKLYQEVDDGISEFLTYALEKDARGKKGLNNYYRQLDMSHFKNLIHFEIRNHLNYNFRKSKVQKLILESDSLDRQAYTNNEGLTLGDIQEDTKSIEDIEESIELDNILSKVDDYNSNRIYMKIKYGEEEKIQPFSYKNLTKLYYDYSDNKKLNSNIFKGIFFNSQTNEELEEDRINKIIKRYKLYMKKNILGGAMC